MKTIADLVWKFEDELNAACTDRKGISWDQYEKKRLFWNIEWTVKRMAGAWGQQVFNAPGRAGKEMVDAALAVNVMWCSRWRCEWC